MITGPELPALTTLIMTCMDGSPTGVNAVGTSLASYEVLEVLVLETVQAQVWGGCCGSTGGLEDTSASAAPLARVAARPHVKQCTCIQSAETAVAAACAGRG